MLPTKDLVSAAYYNETELAEMMRITSGYQGECEKEVLTMMVNDVAGGSIIGVGLTRDRKIRVYPHSHLQNSSMDVCIEVGVNKSDFLSALRYKSEELTILFFFRGIKLVDSNGSVSMLKRVV